MKILAFDLSLTGTGWAGPHLFDFGLLVPPRAASSGLRRLAWIRDQVLERAAGASLVVLEGYAFSRPNQAHQLGELGGVVRLALFEAGFNVLVVPPATAKKYATGRGNAKKEEMLVAAVRRLGYGGASPDEADALWLLALALDLHGEPGTVSMPQANRAALDALRPKKAPNPIPARIA